MLQLFLVLTNLLTTADSWNFDAVQYIGNIIFYLERLSDIFKKKVYEEFRSNNPILQVIFIFLYFHGRIEHYFL